ncbi:MAG: hypothetical protein JNN07_12900 [Verrucomicrobiales bacterium]|nr:hypothetical protein [Verrucomicrobiales bacterium]
MMTSFARLRSARSMSRSLSPSTFSIASILWIAATLSLHAAPNWEAFHDYATGPGTSPNATAGQLRTTGQTATLRNIETADDLPVIVTVEAEGGTPDDFGARNGGPNAGSPASLLFDGKVDLTNDGIPGVRSTVKLTLIFSGLDPSKVYTFCGTALRGGNYNNRWSVYTILGANNAVAAHKDGSANRNIFTAATYPAAAADLAPNQVALNAGHNKDGSLVCWEKIEPSPEGEFRIEALRYMGKTPFGDAPNAGTSYSYGFEAIYLAEFEATGNLRITENPSPVKTAAGRTARFQVTATSTESITYQWQKALLGGEFSDIPGATGASYTTPALTVADDGAKIRCVVSSAGFSTTSGDADLSVDGTAPTLLEARGSINLGAVYLTFSEPLNAAQAASVANYRVSGALPVFGAEIIDSTRIKLMTDLQAPGGTYTVSVSGIEDAAGNLLPVGTAKEWKAFSATDCKAGLELWYELNGGAVSDLRGSDRYPCGFSIDLAVDTMDSELAFPHNTINIYAGRFRAWFTPPESGEYEFFLAGDDQAELRIGLDDQFDALEATDRVPDASLTAASAAFAESGLPGTTAPMPLEKGVRYALQVIWKESNGDDYCRVGVRLVGDTTPAAELPPIPSCYLSYDGGVGCGKAPRVESIQIQGGNIIVTWSGAVLQTSTDLATWTDIDAAANPYSAPNGGEAAVFFRTRN